MNEIESYIRIHIVIFSSTTGYKFSLCVPDKVSFDNIDSINDKSVESTYKHYKALQGHRFTKILKCNNILTL